MKNNELFHKRDASISPHSNLGKWKKYKKITKQNIKINFTNTNSQNQINILKKIYIKLALK